jgi:hypothetical protein
LNINFDTEVVSILDNLNISRDAKELGITFSLPIASQTEEQEKQPEKLLGSLGGVAVSDKGPMLRLYQPDLKTELSDSCKILVSGVSPEVMNYYLKQVSVLLSQEPFDKFGRTPVSELMSNLKIALPKKSSSPQVEIPKDSLMGVLMRVVGLDVEDTKTRTTDFPILNDKTGSLFYSLFNSIGNIFIELNINDGRTPQELVNHYVKDRVAGEILTDPPIGPADVDKKSFDSAKSLVLTLNLPEDLTNAGLFFNPDIPKTVFDVIDQTTDTKDTLVKNLLDSNSFGEADKLLVQAIIGRSTDLDVTSKKTMQQISQKISQSKAGVASVVTPEGAYVPIYIFEMKKYDTVIKKIIMLAMKD